MALEFRQSPRSSLGMEWELQIIDPTSGDLRSVAPEIISQTIHAYPGARNVLPEMLLNTVELISRPRRTVAEAINDLYAGQEMLQPALEKTGVVLAGGGSHPFADPLEQPVTERQRYQELVARTQYWGKQMLLFGTHIHVGVEDREKVLPLLAYLNTWLGAIEALFAASPFWAGVDTGYADNRAMMFQQLPTAGQPRQFRQWEELEAFSADLIRVGAIRHYNEIRWEIRPAPHLGTIEVRVADSATNETELAAYAALVQSVVETASTALDQGVRLPSLPSWLVAENRWRAGRYGLEAEFILADEGTVKGSGEGTGKETGKGADEGADEGAAKLAPVLSPPVLSATVEPTVTGCLKESVLAAPARWADDWPQIKENLLPAAERLGCAAELCHIDQILTQGAAYQRQREVHRATGDLKAVVSFVAAELQARKPLLPAHWAAEWAGRSD